jgi:hypothetical protein
MKTSAATSSSLRFSVDQIVLFLSPEGVHFTTITYWIRSMRSNGLAEVAEAIAEIGAILAAALQRAVTGQSSAKRADRGESSLHISPDQSGDANEWQSGEQR